MTKNTLLTWDVAPSNDNINAHLLSHKRAPQTLFYVPHFFGDGQTPLEALKNGERDKIKLLLIQRITGMVC